jgi:uncharacterized protein involved in exopolysaccharide biosynthesis
MTTAPRFDLVDVAQTLRKHSKILLIATIAAAILGAIFFFLRKPKYEAKTEFLISNPLYYDRNSLFRNTDMRFVDYMGGDDDLDKISAIAESDTVMNMVIKNLHMTRDYNIDPNDPHGMAFMRMIFKKGFNFKRTENKDAIVTFVDYDAPRSAAVANEVVRVTAQVFNSYYNNMRAKMYGALQDKMQEQDSAIGSLTDSLATLRDQYGIYAILSPSRQNVMTGSVSAGKGAGMGMEKIQNIEAIKDQLVADRAKYVSLSNEFSTGTKEDAVSLTQIISKAKAPLNPKGPTALTTILTAALLGFFFTALITLFLTYYRILISVQR